MTALTIINLIILIIMLILNLNFYLIYIINLILLLILMTVTYMKKETLFIIFSFVYIISSLYLTTNKNFKILLFVYYFLGIILLVLYFYHVFNLHNNKMNLTFKSIEFPNDKNYIIAKYLSGPLKNINNNALIKKLDNYFLIQVEDEKGTAEEFKLNFNEIQKIDIKVKPYYKSVKKYEHSNHDYVTSHFESHKGIKIIKSYEIKINTPKDEITLLCFNYPSIFNNINNKKLSY